MFSKKANWSWAFSCYNYIASPMLSLLMVCEYNSNVLPALCTKFETFPFLSHTFRCFMFVSWREVYEHSFHELTMRYSIFVKIHLSRVIPSFPSRKKIMVSLWRSLKTVATLWYVSNVSIIFDAPCFVLHHLPIVSLHLVAFLYAFRN
jgi:hypothetical protein